MGTADGGGLGPDLERVRTIDARQAFVAWLGENRWLEDAVVESLAPLPGRPASGLAPAVVELRMRIQIGGSRVAGAERLVRALRVTARRVREYSLEGDLTPGHVSQGAEALEGELPVAFELDVPGILRLVCEALHVAHTERVETVPAWLSRREFTCEARGPHPTPSAWRERFRAQGEDVVWRRYGGPGVEDAAVPGDYGGWFLQSPDRIPSQPGGVFLRSVAGTPLGCRLTLESWDDDARALWIVAGRVVATLQGVTVRCGNVLMSGPEWERRLDELRRQ
jgi:hypothetical protein